TVMSSEFVWRCNIAADDDELTIPKEFYLAQNYPNPFNPETTIEFGVPHQALVTIEIFDVLGRRVATPVSSQLEPGIHKILWSCDGCATGMYIVRMVSESKVFHHKMLMLK
ncbi:T9SS C-terminal target domain-containing protein, partial [bacterium]